MQFLIGAMNPIGGRNYTFSRFYRHALLLAFDSYEMTTVNRIFTSISEWHFSQGFSDKVTLLAKVNFGCHHLNFPSFTLSLSLLIAILTMVNNNFFPFADCCCSDMRILRTNKKGFVANAPKVLLFIFIARHFTNIREHRIGAGQKANRARKIDETMGS